MYFPFHPWYQRYLSLQTAIDHRCFRCHRSLQLLFTPDRRGFPGAPRGLPFGAYHIREFHRGNPGCRAPRFAYDSSNGKITFFKYGS